MKAIILAAVMALGVTATASTSKTVRTCGYGRYASSNNDCITRTIGLSDPVASQYCMKEGNGGKVNCFNRIYKLLHGNNIKDKFYKIYLRITSVACSRFKT